MSQPIFDKLQRVKAVRDLFYAKFLKLRQIILHGKRDRQQVVSEHLIISGLNVELSCDLDGHLQSDSCRGL